jgi:ribonuclease Y
MFFLANIYVTGISCLVIGIVVGYSILAWIDKRRRESVLTEEKGIIEKARREADTLTREAKLAAAEEAQRQRETTEATLAVRQKDTADAERRLAERDSLLNRQLENLVQGERNLRTHKEELEKRSDSLEIQRVELGDLIRQRREQLESISGLDATNAREQLLKEVERDATLEATKISRRVLDDAKARAEDRARQIIATAIQRYAGEHTFESTTATITLPGDEIKGRIIGREGRNIRAFENATGVTVLIDDTPNAVVLSAFDPVRREIAREAMSRLILDGRIHPTRIEEVVNKVAQEMDEAIVRHGEDAVVRLGLPPMHGEVVKLLGRLHFRQSFCQNLLEHSVEVGHLAGLMAAELGLDIQLAKRSGLLHDIGKAVSQEVEGAHALVGAEILKTHGELDSVINAVASHHGEVPSQGPMGVLVSAADAISASRPGARSETMTTYLKRVEDLERIGLSYPGVEKCFAVQAGRELRVLVQPEEINDEQAFALARNIARKVEGELQYPGQIRVVVLRETKCVDLAK